MKDPHPVGFPLRLGAEIALLAVALFLGLRLWDAGRDVAANQTLTGEAGSGVSELAEVGMRAAETPMRDRPGWMPPRKVVVLDMWPGRTGGLADAVPGIEVVVVGTREDALAEVGDADAVLGLLSPDLIAAGSRLQWVQLSSAGVESYLAMPGVAEGDFTLTNAQRIFAPGGAEHILAMLLALTRRLPLALDLQHRHEWNVEAVTGPTPYVGDGSELVELRGRTMLIAGLGGIGTETARVAHGIGMRVTATRNSTRTGPPFVDYVGLSDELGDLAREADVVVNTLPLTDATAGIFDAALFATMKRGAYFINIGRGRTVDTDALVEALRSGHLAGAGLDVTDPEPLPRGHALWDLPNVIITPHIGGDSDRHMERIYLLFEENLRRFAAGDPLLSVVDRRLGY
jgi:phosphoglycerate dehydrogenase-like enzyme